MAAAERSARAIDCPAGTVLEWAPGLTSDQYEPGGDLVPVPLAGAEFPGPRFTPPGRELVVIDTDGLETLCATPDEALAHIRSLIEGLPVRLACQYPADDELPAEMPAKIGRINDEIPPGGMDVPLFQDTTTGKHRGLRARWPTTCLGGLQASLAAPDRPDLADPHIAARSLAASRSKDSTTRAGQPSRRCRPRTTPIGSRVPREATGRQRTVSGADEVGRGRAGQLAEPPASAPCSTSCR